MGGTPFFPDGWEPDDDHDRGVSDEEFASVVFDEAFVRAAVVHEPTAVERLLAAAQARAEASEAEARRAHTEAPEATTSATKTASGPTTPPISATIRISTTWTTPGSWTSRYGAPGTHGKQVSRWHRPVAWVLALVMGIGMVALAFTAVYRGASSSRQEQVPPPASTGLEQGSGQGGGASPSASADYSHPAVSAIPRTP